MLMPQSVSLAIAEPTVLVMPMQRAPCSLAYLKAWGKETEIVVESMLSRDKGCDRQQHCQLLPRVLKSRMGIRLGM